MISRIRKSLLITCAVAFLAAIPAPARGGGEKDIPPRFSAKTLTGEKFTNESLKGKVVLLEFWTTWCPYCNQDEPAVEKINKELSPQGLVVLAIDVNESKKTVQGYLKLHPRNSRIVLTEDTNLAAWFAAKSYPIYVVIDREGKVSDEARGAVGETGLRNMLRRTGLKVD